jgi:Hint domain
VIKFDDVRTGETELEQELAMTDLSFARHHLFKAAGIAAAGVLANVANAQPLPLTPQQRHDLFAYSGADLTVQHCLGEANGVNCNLSTDTFLEAIASEAARLAASGPPSFTLNGITVETAAGQAAQIEAKADAALAADGVPGALVASCFLKGTRILTAQGERPIEELCSGDLIATDSGLRPVQEIVRWIYPQPWPRSVRPVRISKNALADGVPSRDLIVSQEHAVMVDGALVTADSLINGTTIVQHAVVDCDALQYYHIKLATPAIITAENTPTESLAQGEERLPVLSFHHRRREQLAWHLRSALSPWIDIRQPLHRICDRLAERAMVA